MQKIKLEREMKISHDCGGEFTLPDYEPAIGRMLSAECEPAPEGVYLKEAEGRGTEAELGGLSTFRILYIPEDGGAPHGAVISCDYDTTVMLGPVGGDDSTVLCRAVTAPENVFCRVTAPRKVQLRCRLGSKITVLSAREADGDGDLPGELEVKRGGVEAMAVFSGASRDLLCSCTLDGLPDGAVPVLCRAFVNVTECRPVSAGEYRCRGEVVIECLYEKDGELGTLRCRVEFDETVAIDGNTTPDETSPVRASGYVTSAELHTDDSGSRVEVIYGLDVETVMPFTADVIYDAYSCTSPVAAEYDDTEFLSPAACVSGNISINEHIAKNVSGRVITSQARADISGITAERGRLRVNGELNGTSLIVSGGDYDVVPFSLPWSYELPAPTVADDTSPAGWGSASVSSLSVRADGELAIDAELAVSVTAACVRCERVLASVSAAGEPFPARGGFTVYYPSKSETVWDIAKRFHVPCASVSESGNVNADGTPASVVII